MYDVLIVGGGASGLICGGFAAKNGANVLVAEKKQRPARKILVTGKGRCNLTNNCDLDTFIDNVKTNPYFMYSSYSGFNSQDTMALFESLGIPLETQRGNRVFPKSERAMDIVDAMVRFVVENNGKIENHTVKELIIKSGKVIGVLTDKGKSLYASKVIVATGGLSYPGTGSTGDGYALAKQAGHTIVNTRPSLIPIETSETWVKDIMGLSLKNVELKLKNKGNKKLVYSELGEMIFTHFGISGPLVLSASAHMEKSPDSYLIEIDLKPALSFQQLDIRIQRDFMEFNNRDFSNALDKLLPKSLIDPVIALSGISPSTKVHQITREQRLGLVELLKAIKLTPTKLRPIEEAVITSGGVDVNQVDPYTLESNLVENLYFIGEVLDLDAYTGGFNLQIAFSTAHSAAVAATQKENV